MGPKAHRPTPHLRPHSRSSSATKLAASNLHFSQKDPKHPHDKPKKSNYATQSNEPSHQRSTSPYQRNSSTVHVQAKEQSTNQAPAALTRRSQSAKPVNGIKSKAGFTLAGSAGDDDDEDDWVSSESGAATPSGHISDSDPEDADPSTPVERSAPILARLVENGLKNKNIPPPGTIITSPTPAPTPAKHSSTANGLPSQPTTPSSSPPDSLSQLRPIPRSPRSPTKRYSSTRPSSTLSTRSDIPCLRPHPLFRGQSYGQPGTVPKPAPLAPLTITNDDVSAHVSSSPTSATTLSGVTSSPTPSFMHSTSPKHLKSDRRTSISSARSVATLPVQPLVRERESARDRTRTLSVMSSSSSSAALSSLTHLPTVSRPPSPKAVYFFPVTNPHANWDTLHPLLPAPFLRVHLTTLATRQPILESFGRVARARQRR